MIMIFFIFNKIDKNFKLYFTISKIIKIFIVFIIVIHKILHLIKNYKNALSIEWKDI